MAEKLDGIEVGQVLEVARSEGYKLIADRMRAIHAAKMRELRDSQLDHNQTQALRGFLDGIDRCLSVPDQIRNEWESRKTK
jgi:hypothetical protein